MHLRGGVAGFRFRILLEEVTDYWHLRGGKSLSSYERTSVENMHLRGGVAGFRFRILLEEVTDYRHL